MYLHEFKWKFNNSTPKVSISMSRTVKISLHNNLDLTPLDNPLSGPDPRILWPILFGETQIKPTSPPSWSKISNTCSLHIHCIYSWLQCKSFIHRNCLCFLYTVVGGRLLLAAAKCEDDSILKQFKRQLCIAKSLLEAYKDKNEKSF